MSRQMTQTVIARPDSGREIVIALHTRVAPSDDEWQRWVDLIRARSEKVGWDLARVGNLVITDGGAPSLEQRTAVNTLIAQGRSYPNVAVVTESPLVRTLIRGLTIFNPQLKVFAPAEFARALTFVGFDAAMRAEVIAECERKVTAEIGVGAVKTLEALRGR